MSDKQKKNILLINHYAGSPEMGMEFRPYYLAKEWIKDGYRVDIISADYSHLRIKNPQVKADFEEESIDGVHYHWIKAGKYDKNGVKRALSMFIFVFKLCFFAKKIAKRLKPNVVIASSTYPLDTYAGQKIKKYSEDCILIHEVHDMWPITPIEIGGMSPNNPFIQMLQFAEDSFCKNSDYVVSLLPNAKQYFVEHGMNPNKFYYISNGIVKDEWLKPEELPRNIRDELMEIKKKHKKIICFFGSFTQSYALDYMVDAVSRFDSSNVALVLVGDGNQKEELIKKTRNLQNVYILNKISKRSIPSLLDCVDIIYIGALDNRMFRFGICMNKLFDSMMSGKPILYAVNAPNNYIEQYSCGISVQAESADALEIGIAQFLKMDDDKLNKLGQNGKNAVLDNYTMEKLAYKFEEVFEK